MEFKVVFVMFCGLFLENPDGTIVSHYPFGPMMCKNLCTRTGGCRLYVFVPSPLRCDFRNSSPENGAITFETLGGFCPNNTRLHRGRKQEQLCLSDVTRKHIDPGQVLLLFPNQAVHIDAPRQLYLGSLETTLLEGTELKDTHVHYVIFAYCVQTLFLSRGAFDKFTLEAWTGLLETEVLFQTSSESLLTVDDTKRLLFIKPKIDKKLKVMCIQIPYKFNDNEVSEFIISVHYRISSILAVAEEGRLYAATPRGIYSIKYDGDNMEWFGNTRGEIGLLSLGCNNDYIYYSERFALRRISRTSKKDDSVSDFSHIPKNVVCYEDELYINLEGTSKIIKIFLEEDHSSQRDIKTGMIVPYVMCLV